MAIELGTGMMWCAVCKVPFATREAYDAHMDLLHRRLESAGWRVGTKVPLNVYEGDRPVCQCHNEEDARRMVKAMKLLCFVEQEVSDYTRLGRMLADDADARVILS